MSKVDRKILQILADDGGELRGLEIIRRGDNVVKRGTVYVYLDLLEQRNCISSRRDPKTFDDELPLRLYKITPHGRSVVSMNLT